MSSSWTLRIAPNMMQQLDAHLFPGDHDEHGAVIGASVITTARGTRLLARRLFLAEDGVDYLPGQRGYRMLTASFVSDCALECEAEGLAYLAVHCHGGTDSVGFSGDDLASHERGYPAVLDILDGPPVGGLVFAKNAVAGDIWLRDGWRVTLAQAEVPGIPHRTLLARPPERPTAANERYDRQARLFGDRGQELLRAQKVGVIGAGGAGSLIIEYLARLGVGELLVIDPDRIDPTNLSRVVGATAHDTRPWLTHSRNPTWLRGYGEKHRTTKVDIAARVARAANRKGQFTGRFADVTDPAVATDLTDCDYIFLAADSAQARLVFNALVHQYLIPGIQVGAKAQIDKDTGEILDLFSVIRPVFPGDGCLWCNELISPAKLQEEATDPEQRRRQRYVDGQDIPDPSVITLNAVAAAHATNDYLFNQLGMQVPLPLRWTFFYPLEREVALDVPRSEVDCYECTRRLGAGSLLRLPVKLQ
jgi:molybdopterin/thiamine biosynthesis adenylyltransferase